MNDTPETHEAAERWRQGKINIFDEMARLETERDEVRDTVLRLRKQRAIARNFGEQMERERDEARRLLAAAKESLNAIHVEVGGWIAAMMEEGK
jgi:seryl-tRNA synthetase